jgi:hypothetical protein
MDHDDNRIYLEYVELLKGTDRNQQVITLLEEVVQPQITQQGVANSELYFSLSLAYYREKLAVLLSKILNSRMN